MALNSSCSLKSIMEGYFWHSDTVFANHYLRDVAFEDVTGAHSFGPLVVPQQATNSHRH